MGRALAIIGIIITAGYLLFSWLLVGDRLGTLQTMELNAVGDFLAGAFGPLAILWLVLGFFQQGIELRQGTAALNLQAKELKASVDISTAQLNMAKKNTELENRRLASSIEPKFHLVGGSVGDDAARGVFSFRLFNGGHAITDYKVFFDGKELISAPMFGGMENGGFNKTYGDGGVAYSGVIIISYLNGLEERKFKSFDFASKISDNKDHWVVKVSPPNGIFLDNPPDSIDV
jgi:hypothetical protein